MSKKPVSEYSDLELRRLIEGSIPPENVARCAQLVQDLMAQGYPEADALREMASVYADASMLPHDVFMSLEEDHEGDDTTDFSEDLELTSSDPVSTRCFRFSHSTRIEHTDIGIDLFPKSRLRIRAWGGGLSEEAVTRRFPRGLNAARHRDFVENERKWGPVFFDNLNVQTIANILRKYENTRQLFE